MDGNKNKNKIWRRDITGLRAIAVVPVLLFHAFPGLVPGGFYGVDIFFVISGYLISGIIFRGLVSGSFSFKGFYCKRVKRILPNLILVMLFVISVAYLITTATEFASIGSNVSHSAFFYQNLRLMAEEDYFGILAQNNPLLHIWSLSIEEQFYIAFPFVCFLIWRIGKGSSNGLAWFVFGITIVSFVICLLITDQMVKFYFSFSRFWELGIGCCLAYLEIFSKFYSRRYSKWVWDFLSCLGLFLILCAFLLPAYYRFDSPGVFSLVPVIGCSILIFSNANSLINRTVLSWGWVVFVGLISYSLYIWHWPILSFVRIILADPASYELMFALLLSFFISIFVYRYVENPIREIKERYSKLCVIILVLLLIGAYFSGKIIRKAEGFPDREIAVNLKLQEDWSYPAGLVPYPNIQDLLVIDQSEVPEIVFIGDSHMSQYHSRVLEQAMSRKINIGFMTGGHCMVSIGLNSDKGRCKNATEQLRKLIANKKLRTIVISQKWGEHELDMLEEGLKAYDDLIRAFRAEDASRKVYVVLDNPWDESKNRGFDIELHVPNRLILNRRLSEMNIIVPLPRDTRWSWGNSFVKANLHETVNFIETADSICPKEKCNLSNFKDNDHLRSTYVKENAIWIDQVFD